MSDILSTYSLYEDSHYKQLIIQNRVTLNGKISKSSVCVY